MIGTVILESEIWLFLYYIWKFGCEINGVEIHGNPFYLYFIKEEAQEEEGKRGQFRRRGRGEGGGRWQCDLIGRLEVSD